MMGTIIPRFLPYIINIGTNYIIQVFTDGREEERGRQLMKMAEEGDQNRLKIANEVFKNQQPKKKTTPKNTEAQVFELLSKSRTNQELDECIAKIMLNDLQAAEEKLARAIEVTPCPTCKEKMGETLAWLMATSKKREAGDNDWTEHAKEIKERIIYLRDEYIPKAAGIQTERRVESGKSLNAEMIPTLS